MNIFKITKIIMPEDGSYYYCETFKIDLDRKQHFVKWEILLPKSIENNILHVKVYECNSFYNGIPKMPYGDCYASTTSFSYCNSIMLLWFNGGDKLNEFPKDTGYN